MLRELAPAARAEMLLEVLKEKMQAADLSPVAAMIVKEWAARAGCLLLPELLAVKTAKLSQLKRLVACLQSLCVNDICGLLQRASDEDGLLAESGEALLRSLRAQCALEEQTM